jgi:hypothetical protein
MSRYAQRIDNWLMAAPMWLRAAVILVTLAAMVRVSLPNVPRQYVDFSRIPALSHISQRESYGRDSISDMYGAKVVLNDVADMYRREGLEQTPQEALTWTKEQAAPYPPVALLIEAGLYALGTRTGIGFYGMILALACAFLGLSLVYFLGTRWYIFPLLYANFVYFSERFVYVQDDTYLIMLAILIAALFAARRGHGACHSLMALATTVKLSPLYYLKNVLGMKRRTALLYLAIIVAGLVLPYFVWDNYLYIYRYGNEAKGHPLSGIGAASVAIPFALVIWYVETRLALDDEDRIGWGLVPAALFFALKMNVARHLLVVLLVPDKRVTRNLAAAVGLALPALFPGAVRFNSSLAIATVVLAAGLAGSLEEIGWDVVGDDLRHPGRTAALMLGRGSRPQRDPGRVRSRAERP